MRIKAILTCLTALAMLGLSGLAAAHPPRGIVVDAQGKVYFSDLEQIWMIDRAGRLVLVRPGVSGRHVHELVIDDQGSVYGEEQSYDPSTEEWPSAIWKLSPNRRVTYIVPETRSPPVGTGIWRDSTRCTYSAQQDRGRGPLLFRRCPGKGAELLFGKATDAAAFRQVLLSNVGGTAAGPDGSFYFRHGGTVRRRTADGRVETIASNLAVENFGIAVGSDKSLYVVEHSARRVIRIAAGGTRHIAAASRPPWAPTGVAYRSGSLYVLEVGQSGPRDPISFRVRRVLPNGRTLVLATLPPQGQ